MKIGPQYADNKLYRGIKHVDGYPLTSGDLHEFSDTIYSKQSYLMNNIIGYGLLNTVTPSYEPSSGISLEEPAVVLIDGDISLIHSEGNPLLSVNTIRAESYPNSVVAILGWYQHIDFTTVFRSYGGVLNSALTNDLVKMGVELSTRYQFRWMPVILNQADLESGNISLSIENRDKNGNVINGLRSTITSSSKVGDTYVVDMNSIPSHMKSYAKSGIYIVPIMKYEYNNSNIDNLTSVLPVAPKGTAGFISSDTMPTGDHSNGTVWYNPISGRFMIYVKEAGGFIDRNSTMALMKYRSMYEVIYDNDEPEILIPINIPEMSIGDMLQVVYGGLLLTPELHYRVDYDNNQIVLLEFPISKGEIIVFEVTKVVEANDITNVSAKFNSHMIELATASTPAHVKLSDDIDDTLDASKGVAATPKALSYLQNTAIAPWNIDDPVLIGSTGDREMSITISKDDIADVYNYNTLIEFRAKHQGDIIVEYSPYIEVEGEAVLSSLYIDVEFVVSVEKADGTPKELLNQYMNPSIGTDELIVPVPKQRFPLTLEKGDIVRIRVISKLMSDPDNDSSRILGISNVNLYANYDTPYRYFSEDLSY